MQINRNKKRTEGFNLIEIAIVLAVVGLIIGGIYTAASAVTENNRRRNTQTQLLTIVQNVRTTYASQQTFAAPTNAQIDTMRLFPGDLFYDGTNFINSYGGTTTLGAVTGATFQVVFNGISQGGCVEVLTKSFGTSSNIQQIGLTAAGRASSATALAATADLTGGVSIAEANTVCNADPVNVGFVFSVRG